ncbi:DEKNAAC103380 [Brettanomyces naardenensis]|uniref:DEKNAAC103380 n=1 Tax=Brettanomyces naardenensis TaxID=13370 RepID=A0A448YNQ9_BRENA|nr:DEKNAAC103380 [Brettanomyces naardenensis]
MEEVDGVDQSAPSDRAAEPAFKLGPNAVETVAGLAAGFITTTVSHPLDFIKLRMQLDVVSATQWKAFTKICRDLITTSSTTNGITSPRKLIHNIYRGVGPNLLGSTTAWALYFTFYREYKNLMLDYMHSERIDSNLNSGQYLLCAFGAGWTTSLATNPIWVIKTRMISTSRATPGAYTSIIDGIRQIYRREGFKGYYKGLSPALLNVSQGALQFSIYDTTKHHLILKKGRKENDLTTLEYLYASATSKMIATISLYPLQVIRSRLQVNSGRKFESATNLVRRMTKEEGFKAFYKGVVANLIRVVPATCITFAVYENTRRYLL